MFDRDRNTRLMNVIRYFQFHPFWKDPVSFEKKVLFCDPCETFDPDHCGFSDSVCDLSED